MADPKKFDIIIAGAGAAGLSLLWRILESPLLQNRKVLLIDQSFEPGNDKTWCFWEDLTLPNDSLIHHSWDRLLVKMAGQNYEERLRKYQYKCIRSEDYSRSVLEIAKKSSQVTFLEADVNDFSSDGEYGRVRTSEGNFKSKKVFQSVLKPPRFEDLKVDISLVQHFLGWEITCNQELFDPKTPIFMDFEVPQKDGVSFIYLLPFSKRKALVEYTIFSDQPIGKEQYRAQIIDYLRSNYNLQSDDFSISREEFGAIPMEDRCYPSKYCDFVWNIGTVGGFAKPSTGYMFSRIQKRSSEIIKSFETGNKIPDEHVSPYRFRVYDEMMLYLLANEKENALKVFECLFQKNKFDQVLQFLSEESTFVLELSIFSKMPYLPFFRSIYKMKHRIFSGA